MSLKILHVAAITSENPTGPGHSVPLQILAERKQGNKVAILQTSKGDLPETLSDILKIPWAPPFIPFWPGPFPAQTLFNKVKFWPDIVHFHSVYLPTHASVANAVRSHGIPTVNSPRGGLMNTALSYRNWKKRIGDKLFFDKFCRNLIMHRALNNTEKEACIAKYPKIPVKVVPNPIGIGNIKIKPTRARNTKLVIGFLGRIDIRNKGLDKLLEGLKLLDSESLAKDIILQLVGPDHRGGFKKICRLIKKYNLEGNVLLTGPCYGKEKKKFFYNIDLLVCVSRSEGLPMSVLEAMSFSRPVIVTMETNMADIITEYKAGWVVERDAHKIAKLIREIKSMSKTDIIDYGMNAQIAVKREFSLNNVGKLLDEFYNSILNRKII